MGKISEDIKKRVTTEALKILADNPEGVPYRELAKKISSTLPEVPINIIESSLVVWKRENPHLFIPEIGFYKFKEKATSPKENDTIKEKVINTAREILTANPEGLPAHELLTEIARALPDVSKNTIRGYLSLWGRESKEVTRPKNFFYQLKFTTAGSRIPRSADETAFYEPFARFLENEKECTRAVPLGGNIFRDKWGTPDVIGYREAARDHIYKPPLEVVAAEVKADDRDLVTAFGQTCAYKIFSHRAYVVVPRPTTEDAERLKALCMILGIGLVFHSGKNETPAFEIVIRAQKHEPDMEYVNKYLTKVKSDLGLR